MLSLSFDTGLVSVQTLTIRCFSLHICLLYTCSCMQP